MKLRPVHVCPLAPTWAPKQLWSYVQSTLRQAAIPASRVKGLSASHNSVFLQYDQALYYHEMCLDNRTFRERTMRIACNL